MFDNTLFENWLDEQANRAMQKVTQGEASSSNEMMILVLKAQTNPIAHLDKDLRVEMIALRQDMDKRFDVLTARMDSFMRWSFATTLAVGGLVIGVLKFWPSAAG